uniref:Uncharacterized protein n=1 Tax=Glycine max TaxID=3847 RepID=A0A0R0IC49_SOYBN
MKKVSALAFSILFLAFTIEPFIGIAEAAPEVVLDTSSHKLRIGVKYYILSVFKGKGGGLTISSSDNNTCSFFVRSLKSQRHPVTFTPYNAKSGVILTSIDLNIKSYP